MNPTATEEPIKTPAVEVVSKEMVARIVSELEERVPFTDQDAIFLGFSSLKAVRMAVKIFQVTMSLVNTEHGRLTIIKYFPSEPENGIRQRVECLCECGEIKTLDLDSVKSGRTQSCGCLQREMTSKAHRTHGRSRTAIYNCWRSMIYRCTEAKCAGYKDYGGRGIAVCSRWLDIENFCTDMGPMPAPGYTLEREDNDGNYEPGNCVWATKDEQNRNQRRTLVVEWDGARTTVPAIATRFGIKARFLYRRLQSGMNIFDAVTIPRFSRMVSQ